MSELLESEKRVPTDEELTDYEGLQNIRFRRDSALEVGLFFRPEDSATVVTIKSATDIVKPYIFPVPETSANPAFEEPYSYAPVAGRIILEEILVAKSVPQAV